MSYWCITWRMAGGLMIAVSCILSVSVHAADRHWNVGTGLWTASGNWSPAVVPAPADNAIIDYWDFNAGVGGVARLNTPAVGAVTAVTVTNGAALSMTGGISSSGSLLVGTDVVLGTSNYHGTLNVTSTSPFVAYSGGMTIVQALRLGVLSGVGTVNQNAGTMIVGNEVVLGDTRLAGSMWNPSGVYNLSGGLLRTPRLEIGSHANSNGTFNLSGFGVTNISTISVGGQGVGVVNQSGGTTTPSGLSIGTSLASPPPGTNMYSLSGGSLTVNGITNVRGNGVFRMTGGTPWLGHVHMNSNGRIELPAGADVTLKSYTLHFYNDNAVIEMNDNTYDVAFADIDHRDVLTDALKRGYNGGAWNGNGIRSDVAGANRLAAHPTAVGFANVSDVGYRVKYTYYGDANVDGQVDINDLSRLAASWQTSGKFWYNGDFNYDGFVDVSDLARLAKNWQSGVGAPLAMTFDQALASVGLGDVTVPEPSAIAVLIGMLMIPRRKRLEN